MAMNPKKLKGTRTNKASKNKLKKHVTPQVEMTSVCCHAFHLHTAENGVLIAKTKMCYRVVCWD